MTNWGSDSKRWGHYEDEEETVERVVRADGRTLAPEDAEATLVQKPQVYGTYGGGYTVPPEEIRRLVAEHKKQLARPEAGQLEKEAQERGA